MSVHGAKVISEMTGEYYDVWSKDPRAGGGW